MKKVIQPLAWYLLLTSMVALASSFALSVVTGNAWAADREYHRTAGGQPHRDQPGITPLAGRR